MDQIDWQAKSYTDMVPWDSIDAARKVEPAITREYSLDSLRETLIDGPLRFGMMANNTQHVERYTDRTRFVADFLY